MTERDDSRRRHRRTDTRSRRSVLAAGATCIGTAVAGCSSITGSGPSGNSPSGNGVFQSIGFEGQQMVIDLADDHSVERVNLIGPDGSEFVSNEVMNGATRIEFQILDIESDVSGFEHYAPGEYELVGGRQDSEDVHHPVQLHPELTILSLSSHKQQSSERVDTLKVTVRNDGTAPTWVYDIAYPRIDQGSESSPGDMPGLPRSYLELPEKAAKTVLAPGESRTFVSKRRPFVFDDESLCTGRTIGGELVVATPVGGHLRRGFSATLSGGAKSTNPSTGREEYTCHSGSAQLEGEE